jgi:hypothetical protein
MKRREFLKSLAWVTLAATVPAVAAKDNEPAPNVIVVMPDDQGYPELSIHGNPILKTPYLDQLHDQSLRLAATFRPCARPPGGNC